MKRNTLRIPELEFPWDADENALDSPGEAFPDEAFADDGAFPPDEDSWDPYEEPSFSICDVGSLLDQMVMDIQHLELELVRTRYKLSFHLPSPYDEYMRMEIFSGMGTRYGGDPVYDEYLLLRGINKYDDAIDTPFHVRRMKRLANGYDDYPDLYP